MVNRISTSGRYSQLVADMQKQLSNYNRLTQQLASGSKINAITDDPIGAVNILNTNRQLGQIDIFTQNVEMSMKELSTLDDLMDLATGYLSTAWDKAVQANNQTYGKSSLEALKVEIDEITKTMVDLANTEYNDNYIFGGANTKILPYEQAENGDIIYNGTPYDNKDYIRQTEVADGVFEVINTTGDKVFGYYKSAVEPGNGVYTDANGKFVIVLTEDTPANRTAICKELGRSESNTTFVKGTYTLAYLTELQEKITNAMVNKEIPFVVTSGVYETTNNIIIRVTTNDEAELAKVYALDTIGGAIKVEFSAGAVVEELLLPLPKAE